MRYKIAMLLKQHMCDFCCSLFENRYGNCVLTYFSYKNLDEIPDILEKIKGEYDGVITSGLIPHTLVLSLIQTGELSAAYFGFDVENTYRIILEQSVRRKNFSLSRIGIDFIPEGEDTVKVIEKNRLPEMVNDFERWLRAIPPQELGKEEWGIANRYLERYKKGDIDFIVTYFYSTVIEMQKHGIDCFYLYPNEREIGHTFETIEKSIELRRAALPAVIRIDSRLGREKSTAASERRMIELEDAVSLMLTDNGEGIALNRKEYAIELYTDSHVLKRLTDGYKECFFREELVKMCHFNGTIGYGVANDFYHARSNAMDASSFASNFQDTNMRSILMGEREKIVHLAQGKRDAAFVASPEWLLNAAQTARLSPETILRILEVVNANGTDEITSSELIGRLGVSLRTANRFLSHLSQSGLAEIVGYRSAVGKGRPIAIYKIKISDSGCF